MLVMADGVERGGFALQAQDGTILLSDIDADRRHAEKLAYAYSVSHPEFGDMKVVPVLVRVTVVRA